MQREREGRVYKRRSKEGHYVFILGNFRFVAKREGSLWRLYDWIEGGECRHGFTDYRTLDECREVIKDYVAAYERLYGC